MSFKRFRDRAHAAWIAFHQTHIWVVVVEFHPLGWRIVHRTRSYEGAYRWNNANRRHGEVTRVLTLAEYRRRTIALMESDEPWRELARQAKEINTNTSELSLVRIEQFAAAARRDPFASTRNRQPSLPVSAQSDLPSTIELDIHGKPA
jgi:hypothetical protein